jgi:hypothetical protein
MMGEVMSKGEGELMEHGRRRKYWRVIGFILIAGMILGAVTGYVGAHNDVPIEEAFTALPESAVIALVAFGVAAFTWGCWAFTKAIDEVELADNLWGSTASYYAYAVLFPSWWVLGRAEVAAPPNHWVIFFLSLTAGMAVYGYRKWRAR